MSSEQKFHTPGATRRREAWYVVAHRLRDELVAEQRGDGERPRDLTSPPAIAKEARRSGHSINMLTRFLAVLDWAKRIASTEKTSLKKIEAASFASLEVVRRIWLLDADIGRDLLRQVVAGQIGSRRLRNVLQSLTASKGYTLRQRRPSAATDRRLRFIRAHAVLRAGVQHLSGSSTIRWFEAEPSLWRSPPYASFDGIAVKLGANREIKWIDGFDLREFGGPGASEAMIDALARAAISATYFRRFFLVVIEPRAEQLNWLTKAARDLGFRQFGIAVVEFEPKERLVLIARPSEPATPNRRAQLLEALAKRV